MGKTQVIVGLGSCGIAAGANKTYEKIESLKKSENLNFELKKTSCIGMCYNEPLVEIIDDDGHYLYGNIDEDKALEIIEKHVVDQEPRKDYVVRSDLFETMDDVFFDDQVKIALRNCGYIDPESLKDAEAQGAYDAMNKIASETLEQDKVIKTVLDSGLR